MNKNFSGAFPVHHFHTEGVPGELEGLQWHFPRMQTGTCHRVKLGRAISSLSLLSWKDLPKLCVYGMYSCHFHSALTEIRMSSKCSQKAEGSGRAHVQARWHHIGCLSESWHCILMLMVCWFTVPAALMKSPSIGSLQRLLSSKNNAGCDWLKDQSGPTNCCLP